MGVSLCEFESRPPHSISHEEVSKEASSFCFYFGNDAITVMMPKIVGESVSSNCRFQYT